MGLTETEGESFWPDDWRGVLAIILGIGAVTAINILAAGLVIVAASSHDLQLVPLGLSAFITGLVVGTLVTHLALRGRAEPDDYG